MSASKSWAAEKLRPVPSGEKLRSSTVQLLDHAFPAIDSLDTFCVDHFPMVYRQFSSGMTRDQRVGLLLSMTDPREVLRHANQYIDKQSEGQPYYVPAASDPLIYHREQYVQSIVERYASQGADSGLAVVYLMGEMGTGKSMIARDYANRQRSRYSGVFWLNARSLLRLSQDCAHICTVLGCEPTARPTGSEAQHIVQDWLLEHHDWLLLINRASASAWTYQFLQPLIERGARGHLLLIGRQSEILMLTARGARFDVINVRVPAVDEGVEFLLLCAGRANLPQTELAAARLLVARLGCYPFALAHAGMYLRRNVGLPIAEHLKILDKSPRSTIDKLGIQLGKEIDTYLNRYSKEMPLCAALLNIIAFMAGDTISLHLFYSREGELIPPVMKTISGDFAKKLQSPADLHEQVITPIHEDSLISFDNDVSSFAINPLIQIIVRSRMTAKMARSWAQKAIKIVAYHAAALDSEHDAAIELQDPIVMQVEQSLHVIQELQINILEAAVLLNRAGRFLHEQGRFSVARSYFEQALAVCEEADPANKSWRREAAYSHNGIGRALFRLGSYAQAQVHLEEALARRGELGSHEHCDYAATQNNLGLLRVSTGDVSDAVGQLLEGALSTRRKLLKPDSPLIAKSLNHLGMYRLARGEHALAEAAHREALEIRRACHPARPAEVAQSMDALAATLLAEGRLDEAEQLYQESLQINSQGTRRESPDRAFALVGLARLSLLCEPPAIDQARDHSQEALRLRLAGLEPNHPFLANSYLSLGFIERRAGNYELSMTYLHKAAAYWERVGVLPTHPRLRECRRQLAELESLTSAAKSAAGPPP